MDFSNGRETLRQVYLIKGKAFLHSAGTLLGMSGSMDSFPP
ncbi:hypothetical protein PB1_08977 [Bacillus methanolicus PB1]|uniref:Uncharacterized protein n=1 Tax=Bacillus methanolicus PB1 TaxID=997296 RepID=I3E1W0_BACMT|nr:hypothetical protein PB1_08977 [Bacillus methanolicus PB1]